MTWRESEGEEWKGQREHEDFKEMLADLRRPFDPKNVRGHYILDGHTPIEERDLMKWAHWFEKCDRHVAATEVGSAWVSTVFLGIDHNYFGDDDDPLLFETMVFYNRGKTKRRKHEGLLAYVKRAEAAGEYQHMVGRWHTWEEAEREHNAHVAKLRRRPQG